MYGRPPSERLAALAPAGATTWRQLAERVRSTMLVHLEDELRFTVWSPFAAQEAATMCAERIMLALRELSRGDFKLVVSVQVVPRGGALSSVSSTYWDSHHDGSTVARYEGDGVVGIATAYGIRLE